MQRAFLIVDDERDILDAVERLFRKDYTVYTAESPEEALEMLPTLDVQVVLSDQRMPTRSGVEFLGELRQKYPRVVRVLLTGYSNIDHVVGAINEGHVYRYVSKPWDPSELKVVVRQCFERWEAAFERDHLMAELERKNDELERQNHELKSLDRLKDVFMEVVSHELNTPVAVILGYAYLLRRELGDDMNDVVRKAVRGVESGGNRLRNISNRIFQMMERDEPQSLTLEMVELQTFLGEIEERVRPFLERRGQHLQISVQPAASVVEGDPAKLADILVNLIMNAIKFSPDGNEIRLRTALRAPNLVTIAVEDDGIGISEEDYGQIFDRFFSTFDARHHSSGDFEFGKRGVGLGLSVARRFAQMHGGRIEAVSTPGDGATFTLVLPPTQTLSERSSD